MMEQNNPGIGGEQFKLMLTREMYGDSIKFQVLSDTPKQVLTIVKSKWKIVNWWRRLTNTEKKEWQWVYTVKIVNNNIN